MENIFILGAPKTPPGKETASTEMQSRLVGIYWISSVTKCEMNRIVNQPEGREREEDLSIKAGLQSSHSQSLWNSSLLSDISDILEQRPRGLGKRRRRFRFSLFIPHIRFHPKEMLQNTTLNKINGLI